MLVALRIYKASDCPKWDLTNPFPPRSGHEGDSVSDCCINQKDHVTHICLIYLSCMRGQCA